MKPNHPNITDTSPLITEMLDTAKIISHLDVVVTVDTSVAHLAGAMGKKTFLMLPYIRDWRWFDDKKQTSWYSNLSILACDFVALTISIAS